MSCFLGISRNICRERVPVRLTIARIYGPCHGALIKLRNAKDLARFSSSSRNSKLVAEPRGTSSVKAHMCDCAQAHEHQLSNFFTTCDPT